MRNRYGIDQLGNALIWVALILVLFNIIWKSEYVNLITFILLIYAYYRMFSKNHRRRYAENQWFLNKLAFLKRIFIRKKSINDIKKTNKIFKCPKCKQKVKVPKGKGTIEITCPKCKEKFQRRS